MYTPIELGRGSYASNYWAVYSTKLGRIIRLYSDLEYDHWVLVEGDNSITKYCEKPLKIVGTINGRTIEAIFDMWIEKDGVQTFIIVRNTKKITNNDEKHKNKYLKIKLLEEWCQTYGFQFVLKNEIEIRSNTLLLSNLKTILSYIRNRSENEIDRLRIIKKLIGTKETIKLAQIEGLLSEMSIQRIYEAVSWLIIQGTIKSNIDKGQFGPDLEVSFNDTKKNNRG